MSLMKQVATEAEVSEETAIRVSEALLKNLHRRLVEYREGNGDYLGQLACSEMSDRAFFHLLGFVEQFSINYAWEEGSINEYLGRLPPVERWEAFHPDLEGWKWKR
jgi:hypothetical protein